MDELFNECANNEKYKQPEDPIKLSVNKLMKEIEAEYTNNTSCSVLLDREREKQELKSQISTLKKRIKDLKNPSGLSNNPKKRQMHAKRMNEQRELLRKELSVLQFKLEEIGVEEGNPNEQSEQKIPWKETNPYTL
jgi:phenylalanyl-tRNA synthetase alpha subunit